MSGTSEPFQHLTKKTRTQLWSVLSQLEREENQEGVVQDSILKTCVANVCLQILEEAVRNCIPVDDVGAVIASFIFYDFDDLKLNELISQAGQLEIPSDVRVRISREQNVTIQHLIKSFKSYVRQETKRRSRERLRRSYLGAE